MGTTAEKLAYLAETKTSIKNVIVEKGVEVPDGTTFREYADLISGISTGLSDEVLAKANATPEDVTAGKTFYAGDRTLKSGTAEKVSITTGYTPERSIIIRKPGVLYAFYVYTDGGETTYIGGPAGRTYRQGTATIEVTTKYVEINGISSAYKGFSYLIISE